MRTNNSKESHCDYNDFKRARYFDGEILNKQIFEAEQSYHQEKRKLLNRMLHGWGVVCGLKVKATNPPSSNIIVEPGLALDCQGNEIYVCEEQTVDLSAKTCIQKTKQDRCLDSSNVTPEEKPLYVVIKYQESPSDRVPSYAPSGNCEEKTCDYSRTREGFCIEVRDELPDTPKPNSTNMLCSEPFKCPTCYCCPDPHYIVLATIRCGKRTYMFFSNDTKQFGESDKVEIRYQIKRVLDKVCIDGDSVKVTDTYSYETNKKPTSPKWNKKSDNLGESFKIDGDFSLPINSPYIVSYYVQAKPNSKGHADLGIPVSLSFSCSGQNIELDFPNSQIPIYIGATEAKRGSIISDSMIRNMEDRQFVITYPLISWLTSPLLSSLQNMSESEEGQLFSDNLVSYFCVLMEKVRFQGYTGKTMVKASAESEEERINQSVKKYLEEHFKSEKDKNTVETTGSRYGAVKK